MRDLTAQSGREYRHAFSMRDLTLLFFVMTSAWITDAKPLTDREIRNEAARLAKSARLEPPLMALDMLLRTATLIKPFGPKESQRIFQQAVQHGAHNRTMSITYPVARLWMDYDAAQGEQELRKFADQRRTLQALSAYYQGRNSPEVAATRATEALQFESAGRVDNTSLIETVAAQFPLRIPELVQLAHIQSDPHYAATLVSAIDGLIRAAAAQPDAVKQAAAELEPLLQRTDFDRKASEQIIASIRLNGNETTTSSTKATLLESLDLARRIADPALRPSAEELVRARSLTYKRPGPGLPPVDAHLPIERAVEEVRKRQPAYQQIGELWRYLQAKPRSAEEVKPILLKIIAWSDPVSDPRSDPAWFLQSLLNLDGRLGPPGKGWQLPKGLRPMVFLAAAKIWQQMDSQSDRLTALSLAMVKEKIDIPAHLSSARNRVALDAFRRALESRYEFSLSALDGTTVKLQSLRGKVVLLNFWSTWCSPCRAELPVLERLSKEFGKELEILAITDERSKTVNAFLARNPIALRILLDQPRDTFRHYNVTGIPQSFVIEATGVLRHHFPAAATAADLRAAITAAISSQTTK